MLMTEASLLHPLKTCQQEEGQEEYVVCVSRDMCHLAMETVLWWWKQYRGGWYLVRNFKCFQLP